MCGSDRIYARFGGVGFGGGNRVCRKSCVLLTQVVEINVAYGISKATHWVHVHAKWLWFLFSFCVWKLRYNGHFMGFDIVLLNPKIGRICTSTGQTRQIWFLWRGEVGSSIVPRGFEFRAVVLGKCEHWKSYLVGGGGHVCRHHISGMSLNFQRRCLYCRCFFLLAPCSVAMYKKKWVSIWSHRMNTLCIGVCQGGGGGRVYQILGTALIQSMWMKGNTCQAF